MRFPGCEFIVEGCAGTRPVSMRNRMQTDIAMRIKQAVVLSLLLLIFTTTLNVFIPYVRLIWKRQRTRNTAPAAHYCNATNYSSRLGFIVGSNTRNEVIFTHRAWRNKTHSSMHQVTTTQEPWCSGRPFIELSKGRHKRSNSDIKVKYFLTAVLVVRIYATDVSHFTIREIVQWLQYLSYAGVEHVYVYDSYLYNNECQREKLHCFIETGFVTYIDWSHWAIKKISKRAQATQVPAYRDCLNRFGRQFKWQTAIDIDEYPYSSKDRAPGFLRRVVEKVARFKTQKLGQIFMENYLFLGKPLNDTEYPVLIDRLWRRTKKKWNYSTRKPIYRPEAVTKVRVHDNLLRKGYLRYFPKKELLRMHHYHGIRHKDLDEAKILNITEEDWGMRVAATALQHCIDGCHLGCC